MSEPNGMLSFLAGHPMHHGSGGAKPATGPRVSQAQAEINEIYKAYPPGSAGYRTAAVQKRIQHLMERIHGTGVIVGTGGRTV